MKPPVGEGSRARRALARIAEQSTPNAARRQWRDGAARQSRARWNASSFWLAAVSIQNVHPEGTQDVDDAARVLGVRPFHVHEATEVVKQGVWWSVLFLCVTPPVVEELAFRGVIYGLLRRHLPGWEALVLSSFAFAILHLSIPTLVTHVPLGLYFCWLRQRGGSLWPSMVAHGLHNGWVLAQETVGVLPPFGW
jgi:membrane protease YdiL (CAAX protease family)